MSDMTCPIDGCDAVFCRNDMVLNTHLRFKHKDIGPKKRTAIRLKYTPCESGFKSQGVSQKERQITKTLGI